MRYFGETRAYQEAFCLENLAQGISTRPRPSAARPGGRRGIRACRPARSAGTESASRLGPARPMLWQLNDSKIVFKENPMTNILIVDDSPIDRRLVGELLSQNPGVEIQYAVNGAEIVENTPVGELAAGGPCLQIDYAENGREALAKLARHPVGPGHHRSLDAGNQRPAIGGRDAREIPADPGDSHDLAGQRGDRGPGLAARRGKLCPQEAAPALSLGDDRQGAQGGGPGSRPGPLDQVHAADREHLPPGERPRAVRAAGALPARGDHSPRRLRRGRSSPRGRRLGRGLGQRPLPRQSRDRLGTAQHGRLSRPDPAAALPVALPGAAHRSRGPHHPLRGRLRHPRRRSRLRSRHACPIRPIRPTSRGPAAAAFSSCGPSWTTSSTTTSATPWSWSNAERTAR